MAQELKHPVIRIARQKLGEDRRWRRLDVPEVTLDLQTSAGHLRRAQLDRATLLRLIADASGALLVLDRAEGAAS